MKFRLTTFIAYSVTGLLGALVIANKPAQAATMSLSDLEKPGASLTEGPLVYSGFTYSATSSTSGYTPISPSAINVSTLSTVDGPGLEITGGFNGPSDGPADLVLTYNVQDTVGSIKDFQLSFDATADGNKVPGTAIDETVYSVGSIKPIGEASVTPGIPTDFKAANLTSPQSSVTVKKDISLAPNGRFSIIDQAYSTHPDPTAVPEPSSVLSPLVFGALFGGYTLMRKRKQKMLLNLGRKA